VAGTPGHATPCADQFHLQRDRNCELAQADKKSQAIECLARPPKSELSPEDVLLTLAAAGRARSCSCSLDKPVGVVEEPGGYEDLGSCQAPYARVSCDVIEIAVMTWRPPASRRCCVSVPFTAAEESRLRAFCGSNVAG
jgi:hypothetical protein